MFHIWSHVNASPILIQINVVYPDTGLNFCLNTALHFNSFCNCFFFRTFLLDICFVNLSDQEYRMSEAVKNAERPGDFDMMAYTSMTDEVFTLIRNSRQRELEESRVLLARIQSRNLYRFVHETTVKDRHVYEAVS